MKKTTTPKKLLLSSQKVRDLTPIAPDKLANVVGGGTCRDTFGSGSATHSG